VDQPRQDGRKGAFATTGFSDKPNRLPFLNSEGYVVNGLDLAVGFCHMIESYLKQAENL